MDHRAQVYSPQANCCWGAIDRTHAERRCLAAPLCTDIRVAVGAVGVVEEQTIEIGWAPNHLQGLLVAVHVHEVGASSFVIDVPLGLLLKLWGATGLCTRLWRDERTQLERATQLEVLGDGSVLLKCTAPDAGVLVPAAMLPSFKEAVGLLLRLADKTVGNKAVNLTDAGGTMTTPVHCPVCTGERSCKTSAIGIRLCAASGDGALGITHSSYFAHVDGHAATKVRIVGDEDDLA